MADFLQLHLLTAYGPSNLNRTTPAGRKVSSSVVHRACGSPRRA